MEIEIVVNEWFYINCVHQRSFHETEMINDCCKLSSETQSLCVCSVVLSHGIEKKCRYRMLKH